MLDQYILYIREQNWFYNAINKSGSGLSKVLIFEAL